MLIRRRNALIALMSIEQPPVSIPYATLSARALRGVVESFVLREGTDYGTHEFTLEEKVAQVLHQLERGEAEVMFDPESNTVDIVCLYIGSRS